MEKNTDLSRRNFLKVGAGAILGGAVLGGIGGTLIKPGKAHAALGYLPTTTLDVDYAMERAWFHYFNSGG